MNRLSIILTASLAAALALASAAGAQSMMKAAPQAGGTGSMTAAPATGAALTGTELRLAAGSGGKVQFTDLAAAQALAARGPTVLFFAADWCPTCKDALRDINANGAGLKGVTVVVVNYDESAALKTKYGVTYQHTFVRIDKNGKALDLWNGGGVAQIAARAAGKM